MITLPDGVQSSILLQVPLARVVHFGTFDMPPDCGECLGSNTFDTKMKPSRRNFRAAKTCNTFPPLLQHCEIVAFSTGRPSHLLSTVRTDARPTSPTTIPKELPSLFVAGRTVETVTFSVR